MLPLSASKVHNQVSIRRTFTICDPLPLRWPYILCLIGHVSFLVNAFLWYTFRMWSNILHISTSSHNFADVGFCLWYLAIHIIFCLRLQHVIEVALPHSTHHPCSLPHVTKMQRFVLVPTWFEITGLQHTEVSGGSLGCGPTCVQLNNSISSANLLSLIHCTQDRKF